MDDTERDRIFGECLARHQGITGLNGKADEPRLSRFARDAGEVRGVIDAS